MYLPLPFSDSSNLALQNAPGSTMLIIQKSMNYVQNGQMVKEIYLSIIYVLGKRDSLKGDMI